MQDTYLKVINTSPGSKMTVSGIKTIGGMYQTNYNEVDGMEAQRTSVSYAQKLTCHAYSW